MGMRVGMAEQIKLKELSEYLLERAQAGRILVGIGGPPGVGKSTFCEDLKNLLNSQACGTAEILPMDGFHFDNDVLKQKEWLEKKGAPHTFDVMGFLDILKRVRRNGEAFIAVPVFDREVERARAGARLIEQACSIILVEGNYVLLNREPWLRTELSLDVSVMLQADERELERRLIERWQNRGARDAEIERRVHQNDLVNARDVLGGSREADFVVLTA